MFILGCFDMELRSFDGFRCSKNVSYLVFGGQIKLIQDIWNPYTDSV